eukprot:COSAG02_NODE_47415_length_341_cov_0.842975_1_plen_42_part_10
MSVRQGAAAYFSWVLACVARTGSSHCVFAPLPILVGFETNVF